MNGLRILNLNDCILARKEQLTPIEKIAPKPNVLFTQFSYAGWLGSPENPKPRREAAGALLEQVRTQCEVFRPEFVVPFASFIFFSHIENSWMNDSVNTPPGVVEFLKQTCGTKPVILVPNEEWDGRSEKDNDAGLQAWTEKYKAEGSLPLHTAPSVSEEQLFAASQAFREKMFEKNSSFLVGLLARIGLLPEVRLRIWDFDKVYSFSWLSGLTLLSAGDSEDADVAIGADSVMFLFSQDYGADTLNVNARFRGADGARKKLLRTFAVPSLNNTGRFLNWSIVKLLAEPAFIKQGLQAVGLLR